MTCAVFFLAWLSIVIKTFAKRQPLMSPSDGLPYSHATLACQARFYGPGPERNLRLLPLLFLEKPEASVKSI
jgi:hypothetical protein